MGIILGDHFSWMRLAVVILLLGFGAVIYLRSHKPNLSVPFLGLSIALSIHVLTRILMDIHIEAHEINTNIFKINSTAAILANLFFWIFIMRFTRSRWPWIKTRWPFATLPIFAAVNWFLYDTLELSIVQEQLVVQSGGAYLPFFFAISFVAPIHSLYLLKKAEFNPNANYARISQFRQMFWGIVLSLLLVTLPSISYLRGNANHWLQILADLGYLAFTVFTGHSVLRSKALEIKGTLGTLLLWIAISTLLYLPGAFLLEKYLLNWSNGSPQLLNFIFVGLLIFGIVHAQSWLQERLNRIFRSQAHFLDQLRSDLMDDLSTCRKLGQLDQILQSYFVSKLRFDSVQILEKSCTPLLEIANLHNLCLTAKKPIERYSLSESEEYAGQPWINELAENWLVFIPLVHHGEMLGLLVLGEHQHKRPLSKPEQHLLAEIRVGLALAYSNVQAFDLLQQRNQELLEISKELEQKFQDAQAASRAKDEFLAVISHELRTPLNGVVGIAQLLSTKEFNTEEQEMIADLRTASQTMCTQVNQVLDYTLVKSDSFSLDYRFFDPAQCTENLHSTFAQIIARKELILHISGDLEEHILLRGDLIRIQQMVDILVANACKFSRPMGEIQINQELSLGNQARLRFEIIDQGIGISPDNAPKIFDHFVQVDSSLKRSYEGMGLGLCIAQNLAQHMHSQIHFQSTEGQGSKFWFELLLDYKKQAQTFENQTSNFAELNLLVAEDNALNQKIMTKLLNSQGLHNFKIVENGTLALEAFQEIHYDLVLMDIQMPVMDGIKATELIREFEAQNQRTRTPILAVTANIMPGDPESYKNSGIDEIIAKPVQKGILSEAIIRWTKANPT